MSTPTYYANSTVKATPSLKNLPLTDEQRQALGQHEKLIWLALRTYANRPGMREYWDDFYGILAVALVKAFQDHNPTRGAFSTYAMLRMRGDLWGFFSKWRRRNAKAKMVWFDESAQWPTPEKKRPLNWQQIRAIFDGACLNEREKDAIFRYYQAGQDTVSIARELGLTHQGVSVRLSRAKQKLRAHLKRRGFGLADFFVAEVA